MNKILEYKIGHKKISTLLPTLGVLFVLVVIMGLLFMNNPHKRYRVSSEEMLTKVIERKDVIRPEKFMDIQYNNKEIYRFIDLRPANEYLKDHIEGAINIPINKLFSEEFEPIVNQDEKINIFYCSEECEACSAWMLLKQLGYKNNKVLQGNYSYIKENIIDNYAPMSGFYKDEKANYDFAKIVKETAGSTSGASSAKLSVPKVKIKKVQEAEEEGGC